MREEQGVSVKVTSSPSSKTQSLHTEKNIPDRVPPIVVWNQFYSLHWPIKLNKPNTFFMWYLFNREQKLTTYLGRSDCYVGNKNLPFFSNGRLLCPTPYYLLITEFVSSWMSFSAIIAFGPSHKCDWG